MKSKTSRRSDLHSFQQDSEDSYNQILTKKKNKLNHKSMENDLGYQFVRDLKNEIGGYSPEKAQMKPREGSNRSENDSVIDQIMETETGKGFHKKLGFGFFMLRLDQSNDRSSIYNSSMTHRLLDALLDDNMLSDKKTSINKESEKMNFSKTTDPEKTGLKDLLSKIKKDMQKKMSIQDMDRIQQTFPELHKTFETIQSEVEERSLPKEKVLSKSVNQIMSVFQDRNSKQKDDGRVESQSTERVENFESNVLETSMLNPMNLLSERNPLMVQSSTISQVNPEKELTLNGEPLQKRVKHSRFGSMMSQKSNVSGSDNWRSRLGEKIRTKPQKQVPEMLSQTPNIPKIEIPTGEEQGITEESNELTGKPINHLKDMNSENETEFLRSPELAKNIQKRLKNLIMKPDKQDKELLKQKLVRTSKANKSVSKIILSQNSSIEITNETIGLIVATAKKTVLKTIRKRMMKIQEENYQYNQEEYIEKIIRDLSRRELEDSMIKISNDLNYFGIGTEKVQGGIERFVKDVLENMKNEVEKPFEELVKQNISRLEDSKNYLDLMEMENIELEYGMLKLTQMYNEIIQTLEVNGITLEISEDLEDEEGKTQMVKSFSLRNFRKQIKYKVQKEKNELDKNLFEIQEDVVIGQEEIGGTSCLQMKSIEINLGQDPVISENIFGRINDSGKGLMRSFGHGQGTVNQKEVKG